MVQSLYIGIAVAALDNGTIDVGFASHDGTYSIDFAVANVQNKEALADYLIKKIRDYQENHLYKFVGAGLTEEAVDLSPTLPSRLWGDLDIVPLTFDGASPNLRHHRTYDTKVTVDEEADSMVRKCLGYVQSVIACSTD